MKPKFQIGERVIVKPVIARSFTANIIEIEIGIDADTNDITFWYEVNPDPHPTRDGYSYAECQISKIPPTTNWKTMMDEITKPDKVSDPETA